MSKELLDQERKEIEGAMIGKKIVSLDLAPCRDDVILNLYSITLDDGTVIKLEASDYDNIVGVFIR